MQSGVQFLLRLVVALGIVLSGLNPSMAAQPHSMTPMAAGMQMAGMLMPEMPINADKSAPGKDMPCGGMGCCSCICGTCAVSLACDAWHAVPQGRPTGRRAHGAAALRGITFPPDIRPPIPGAIAS